MTIIPSLVQAAYDRAFASCKIIEPRIPASLDGLPLGVLEDPDRGTLEAIEARALHAMQVGIAELEVVGARFLDCALQECDLTGALFMDTVFEGCDLSNSMFDNAAFTRCIFKDCKLAGASFAEALWEHVSVDSCMFAYSAFNRCRWKAVSVRDSDLSHADLSEMSLRSVTLSTDRFIGTSFFRTKLVGLDLTSCQMEGMIISDAMDEVFGTKLSLYQAASLAKRLGVIIDEEQGT